MNSGAATVTAKEAASRADVLPERRVEEACLGAALVNDVAARVVAEEVETAAFASAAHRAIHTGVCRLVARGEDVDHLTVAAELERSGAINLIPGRDYLCVLAETTPAATHVRSYIARVKELARERHLRAALEKIGMSAQGRLDADSRTQLQGLLAESSDLLETDIADHVGVSLYDGAALAGLQLETPVALCEGLLYVGCSTDLVAEVKRGKTTMALAIARDVINGEPWCGRTTRKSGVLYLSEQSPHSFVPQVARAGLLGEERFCTLFHRDALALSWPEIGKVVERCARERGLNLVVVDNLSLWAGIEGDEENDAGVALATLRVIERLTGCGLAVLVLRHARKGGGSISEAGRGSSALAGGFDVLLHLKGDAHPRRRQLSVTGRVFAAEPPDWVIEMDDAGRYRSVGSVGAVKERDLREMLLGLLPATKEEAITEATIIEHCQANGIGKPKAQDVLRELCDENDPERPCERAKGAGSASSRAYGYWRRGDATQLPTS
ncbi:MAG: DnaB-like helicase N-terminal domain-containing protein [Thermoleophilia bacterium]